MRPMKRLLFSSLTLVGLCACDESGPRVYTARLYRPDLGCLEEYAPLGLVEGGALSSQCEPVCLVLGDELYVSTVCPPYPAELSVEEPVAERCGAALTAVASELACGAAEDGGLE